MRLLNTSALELKEFADGEAPRYAILSHTWDNDKGELSLQDLTQGRYVCEAGYKKVKDCCSVAKDRGFDWVWIDTCCIDKTSSAELSEAINSMYQWYQDAADCLTYLSDVPSRAKFSDSRWFTRGWTLQELIAPPTLVFFDENWTVLGTRVDLQHEISSRTRIPPAILSGGPLDAFSISQKMSWAAGRKTTRTEDRAYSLLGIFGINMPLIYGEKETSFLRLQEEIIKVSDDQSLFAWRSPDRRGGLLATSPDAFAESGNIIEFTPPSTLSSNPLTVSGRGIHLDLPFIGISPRGVGLAVLRCKETGTNDQPVAIYLRDTLLTMTQFERVRTKDFTRVRLTRVRLSQRPLTRICIRKGRMMRAEALNGFGYGDEGEAAEIPKDVYPKPLKRHAAILQAVDQGREGDVWLLLSQKDFQDDLKHSIGQKLLLQAIERGSEHVIRVLLARNEIDADKRDSEGRTLLSKAAENGNIVALRPLLSSGKVEVESEDSHSRTPLSWAAGNGHRDAIPLLVEQGADIESKDAAGRTPLSHAAGNGRVDALQELLKLRVNTETADADGRTPLSWAAGNGCSNVIPLLIQQGAAVDWEDASGRTPLSHAATRRDEASVQALLEAGADVESMDRSRHTPLDYASLTLHTPTVRLFLNKLLSRARSRRGSYYQSCGPWNEGFEAAVSLLCGKDIDFEMTDREGGTLLSWTAGNRLDTVVRLLIGRSVSIGVRDNKGQTALMWAASSGSTTATQLLLESGETSAAKEKSNGWLPGTMAMFALPKQTTGPEDRDVEGRTALFKAAMGGYVSVVDLLLKRGANIETNDKHGLTPLSRAAWEGHEMVVYLLLERGAYVETKDKFGQTPLSRAAEEGHEKVVSMLLERGAWMEVKDVYGQTPLSLAAEEGRETVVRLLLGKGANAEIKDVHGQTPLSLAAEEGFDVVVRLLLERGAETEIKDVYGWTPLQWAKKRGHSKIVKLLRGRRGVPED